MGKKQRLTQHDDFPLGGYLDGIVERLRELVPVASQEGDVDATHQSRVATRRLRAAIALIEPLTSETDRKPLLRTLRKLRRRLGPLRDLDVMLAHLGELKRNRTHRPAIEWVESKLQADRAAAASAIRDEIAPSRVLGKLGAWWGLRQQMTESHAAVDALITETLRQRATEFADQAQRLGAEVEPADPHALRISGKLLRYTLEMAGASGHALPKSILKQFKHMQDCLGEWHDYVVLTERMMLKSSDELLAHHDAGMQRAVLALAQFTLSRSNKHLERFVAVWQEQGAAITQSILAMYPDTAAEAVTQSQTGPDPAGSAEPLAMEEPAAVDRPAA